MIEITYDKVVHSSDHFDKILQFTEQLIKQGDAYMDDTDGETVSLSSSVCSNADITDQLAETSTYCLREAGCFHRRQHGQVQGDVLRLHRRKKMVTTSQD